MIHIPKAAVPTEPPHVQKNPIYPDDLRSYDTARARAQRVLQDSHKKNYEFGSYHIPVLAENKTRQEVAQSETLSGRFVNPYTTGGTSRNGVTVNTKDPTVQNVRGVVNFSVDDRSTYQSWSKKQHGELTADIMQSPQANTAAISQPTEWMASTSVRSFPRYINVAEHQHGWADLQATNQRADIVDIDTMYKKRLVQFSNQGNRSSQVTHYAGHDVDGNALTYPTTNRKRDIHPEVGYGGLMQGGGTGRAFLDANSGLDENGDHAHTRDIIVPKMNQIPHVIGEDSTEYPGEAPWLSYNPTVDHINVPRGHHDAWHAQATPTWQSDNAHTLHVPLVR